MAGFNWYAKFPCDLKEKNFSSFKCYRNTEEMAADILWNSNKSDQAKDTRKKSGTTSDDLSSIQSPCSFLPNWSNSGFGTAYKLRLLSSLCLSDLSRTLSRCCIKHWEISCSIGWFISSNRNKSFTWWHCWRHYEIIAGIIGSSEKNTTRLWSTMWSSRMLWKGSNRVYCLQDIQAWQVGHLHILFTSWYFQKYIKWFFQE